MQAPLQIHMQGVSLRYASRMDTEVIRNLDFSSREGEFICLLGPSGCGKSSVLRLLAGFQQPTSGVVQVNSRTVTEPSNERAVVFQGDDSLFEWLSAYDNVAFGPRMRGLSSAEIDPIAMKFLRMVGLADHAHKFPRELSGGMRQRIQIARVLANNPRIMLMDEPFAALDAQTRTELQDELIRIWSADKKSVVFITHDIGESIVLADRIGIMSAGPGSRIIETIEVDLPRPRSRANPKFGELYERIGRLIHDQVKSRARHAQNA